MFIHPP